MRRFSYLLLIVPVVLLTACQGGLQVDLGNHQEPQATPVIESEPLSEPDTPQLEVLVFTAKWCPACQRDKPQIEELRKSGAKITIVDYDVNPEVFKEYGVTQMPTYIVLDEDGNEVQRTGSIFTVLSLLSVMLRVFLFFLSF